MGRAEVRAGMVGVGAVNEGPAGFGLVWVLGGGEVKPELLRSWP